MALQVETSVWLVFHLVVLSLIAVDLIAGIRRGHALTFREAVKWVILWIGFAVAFGIFILFNFGTEVSTIYYTAYVLEYTLSVDNLFVFAAIFSYFAVPAIAQPVVLYVGIVSAIVMRATFMLGGILLLENFGWMVFVFGAILIYSGTRLWRGAQEVHPDRNPVVKLAKRFLPITEGYDGAKFFLRTSKKLVFTPLIVVLLAVESTDLIFAVDSIPAALALTRDFFIAYTSNISAIIGLRSLYFLIALTIFRFRYVGKALAFILVFLGVKFFLGGIGLDIPIVPSISIVLGVIAISVVASLSVKPPKTEHQ